VSNIFLADQHATDATIHLPTTTGSFASTAYGSGVFSCYVYLQFSSVISIQNGTTNFNNNSDG
jgi:hypothetical protein